MSTFSLSKTALIERLKFLDIPSASHEIELCLSANALTLYRRGDEYQLYARLAVTPSETEENDTVRCAMAYESLTRILSSSPDNDSINFEFGVSTGPKYLRLLSESGLPDSFDVITQVWTKEQTWYEPDYTSAQVIRFPSPQFEHALGTVRFAAKDDKDNVRPALSGILVQVNDGELAVAAADGYRLAEMKLGATLLPDMRFVIPVEVVAILVDLWHKRDVCHSEMLLLSNSHLVFRFESGEVICNPESERGFPPYGRVIPAKFNQRATFSRERLLRVMRALVNFNKPGGCTLSILPDNDLAYFCIDNDFGSVKHYLPCVLEGEKGLGISFNPFFLMQVLESMPVLGDEDIRLNFTGKHSPIAIKTDSCEQFVSVLMPTIQ